MTLEEAQALEIRVNEELDKVRSGETDAPEIDAAGEINVRLSTDNQDRYPEGKDWLVRVEMEKPSPEAEAWFTERTGAPAHHFHFTAITPVGPAGD